MQIDKSYRLRFLLDGYTLSNDGKLEPVAEGFTRSFSTKGQAEEVLEIAKRMNDPKLTNFKCEIGDGSKMIVNGVNYNYRDDTDSNNLFAHTINCSFNRQINPDESQPGSISVLVGDLIGLRLRQKPNSNEIKMDSIGQLYWA